MQIEEQREKGMNKNEESLREMWDTTEHITIHIMGLPEGNEGGK